LRRLSPLFGESEPDDAVRDNAAGAVARMIMVHPELIPLNEVILLMTFFVTYYVFFFGLLLVILSNMSGLIFQVLPVFLKVLPLKEDHEESMAVYTCVSTLVLSSNAEVSMFFRLFNLKLI
jgi:hypothetical protein